MSQSDTDENDAALADVLGHRFRRPALLAGALTHPSATDEPGGPLSYERLEFLGDRVLGLVVAEMLLARHPDESEGALSRRLVGLVRREALIAVAESIGLDRWLRMASPPQSGMDQGRATALADGCEALIGALYLDGGLAPAAAFVHRHWRPLLDAAPDVPQDAKTALQEWTQGRALGLPSYAVVARDGPAHQPLFTVQARVDGFPAAIGTGPSKRAAEQAAAAALLAELSRHDG